MNRFRIIDTYLGSQMEVLVAEVTQTGAHNFCLGLLFESAFECALPVLNETLVPLIFLAFSFFIVRIEKMSFRILKRIFMYALVLRGG